MFTLSLILMILCIANLILGNVRDRLNIRLSATLREHLQLINANLPRDYVPPDTGMTAHQVLFDQKNSTPPTTMGNLQ